MRDLLAELNRTLQQGQPCVWCAVVETRGSTPQKAGAGMLVFPNGDQRGTLGGGCTEAEVKRRALAILADADHSACQPELLTFCLDDDYGWDDGLICGGRMTMLVDPLASRQADDYHRQFQTLLESGKGAVEAIVLAEGQEAPPGSRFLFDGSGRLVATRGRATSVPQAIVQHLPDLGRRPTASAHGGVAYLPFLPRITVFLVGGGHVGQAVAQLASQADFDVEVLDDRDQYVTPVRFPEARRRLVGDIGQQLAEIGPTLTQDHYVLIVTRGHRHDEEALFHLAPTRAGYIGMIGSKRKIRLIYEDLLARGIAAADLDRVHAPLGFDIGSQTVPEIAISIVAELIAARNLGSTDPRPRVRLRCSSLGRTPT
ncbi:MAG: XdhC family protein [Gemmataceae bacterium]